MLVPELDKWKQTVGDIREQAFRAEHRRTRERFLALYLILTRGISATTVAEEMNRDLHTTMRWVHRYNDGGPEALTYRRSGGRRPLFRKTNSGSSATS